MALNGFTFFWLCLICMNLFSAYVLEGYRFGVIVSTIGHLSGLGITKRPFWSHASKKSIKCGTSSTVCTTTRNTIPYATFIRKITKIGVKRPFAGAKLLGKVEFNGSGSDIGDKTSPFTEEKFQEVFYNLSSAFTECVKMLEKNDIKGMYERLLSYAGLIFEQLSPFYNKPREITQSDDEETETDESTERQNSSRLEGESDKFCDKSLSYIYTTEDTDENGDVVRRRWKMEIKDNLPKRAKSLIISHRNKCSSLLGCIMKMVTNSDHMLMINKLVLEVARFGIPMSPFSYEGIAIMYLRSDRFKDALMTIEKIISLGYTPKYRTYEPLITYLEDQLDVDNMLLAVKHSVDVSKLKLTGFWLARVMLAIAFSARQKLLGSPKDRTEVVGIYSSMKSQLKLILELYKNHNFDTISLSSRLGYIISRVFEDISPDIVRFTHVSPNRMEDSGIRETDFNDTNYRKINAYGAKSKMGRLEVIPSENIYVGIIHSNAKAAHGECASCRDSIPLLDLSPKERLNIFETWIKFICDFNSAEVLRLAKFYKVLYDAKQTKQPYTCILDGQNVGYHRRMKLSAMDFTKVEAVRIELERRGERPLIVLPFGFNTSKESHDVINAEDLKLFFPDSEDLSGSYYISQRSVRRNWQYQNVHMPIFDLWKEHGSVYTCNSLSYDDNYFFLAILMTGCLEEIQVFAKFIKKAADMLDKHETESGGIQHMPVLKLSPLQSFERGKDSPQETSLGKNMIIVTNDTLCNLAIPGVESGTLERLRNLSLAQFHLFDSPPRGMRTLQSETKFYTPSFDVFVGNRLKYSLDIKASKNLETFHIPLGYERTMVDYGRKHRYWQSVCNEHEVIPPIYSFSAEIGLNVNKSKKSRGKREDNVVDTWIDKHGYDVLLREIYHTEERNKIGKISKNFVPKRNKFEICTKTPEITQQKFSLSQITRWLCINLLAIDNIIATI